MGKEQEKERIIKPNLILCEGKDPKFFIDHYLSYLLRTDKEFDGFQAISFGGNQELPRFLLEFSTYPDFDQVVSIIVLRDAEDNFEVAVQAVQNALNKAGFPVPKEANAVANGIVNSKNMKAAFSLFPSLSCKKADGTVEDLYWNNLKEEGIDWVKNEILTFLDTVCAQGRSMPRMHKTKLHSYFSVTDKYLTMKIGEATKAGAFDFECTEMLSLKELLLSIIEN
ncbi:MAG: hypothetical protein FWH49_08670 [Clostridiales bacterium]|nr:hypothetical protein [Clostridiales bacterium]